MMAYSRDRRRDRADRDRHHSFRRKPSAKRRSVTGATTFRRYDRQAVVPTNHIRSATRAMKLFTIVFERVPMVWFLLGLLFNAGGLYLGFDRPLSFVYLVGGWCCCVYGVAVYVFRRLDRPRTTEATRLSPKFISAGATTAMPAMRDPEPGKVKRGDD
jgi:hypothetical protein